jgi:hypothetical protein
MGKHSGIELLYVSDTKRQNLITGDEEKPDTKLDPETLEWHLEPSWATEGQTFYLHTEDGGFAIVQMVYSTMRLVTMSSTWRFLRGWEADEFSLWYHAAVCSPRYRYIECSYWLLQPVQPSTLSQMADFPALAVICCLPRHRRRVQAFHI